MVTESIEGSAVLGAAVSTAVGPVWYCGRGTVSFASGAGTSPGPVFPGFLVLNDVIEPPTATPVLSAPGEVSLLLHSDTW